MKETCKIHMNQLSQDNFTEKAWQSILQAQSIAVENLSQNIDSEHLLLSLISKNKFATEVLTKANISTSNSIILLKDFINKQPKLKSSPDTVYVSKNLKRILDYAEESKRNFGDKLISTEHLLISLSTDVRFCKHIYLMF